MGASCYSSMHIFLNAVRTGEARGAEEGETGRAAAFINREIDGDVSSSAAGSAGRGGKKRRSREERGKSWQAARCIVSMTSNMLIRSLHSYRVTKGKKNEIITAAAVMSRQPHGGTDWFTATAHAHETATTVVNTERKVLTRMCAAGTPCV